MRALVDLLLPPTCPGCGREGAVICARCRKPLDRRLDEPPGAPVGLPVTLPNGLIQIEWCAAFTGPTRAALHALKYDGERRLATPLGLSLAARWRRAGVGGDVLVPVPVHASRRRERGFDQAELLATVAARALRLPMDLALERREPTAAQHSLGRQARAQNVGGAFALRPGHERAVRGRWVVLIDDVTTTGATLTGCAAALHAAGVQCVSALTVARER
ncbi:MAG: ComF family protein [Candidatus Limnocylindrales bacterium]